jgi:hypothetical protein
MHSRIIGTIFIAMLFSGAAAQTPAPIVCPPVFVLSPMISSVPAGTNPFYGKYINADGIPILASSQVCDRSLQIVYEMILKMLSKRPDYLANLIQKGVRVSVFAVNEKMTDLPEDRDLAGVWIDAAHTRKYDDTCGGGAVPGRPTTVCESNLIGVQDPYYGRMSVFIHEFGHTIQNLGLDTATANAVLSAYADAQKSNLFTQADGVSTSYMMSNDMEFFAEGTGNWFNAADPTNPANSPEEQGRKFIASYDPEYYQILQGIYPDDSWVYPRR